jgi:3-carboxy-cis,cis-muconate cycloisomerase
LAAPPERSPRSATRVWWWRKNSRRHWSCRCQAPWHTHRDRIADAAAALAIVAGSCGKIARDVSLLMQTDVGEAFEPSGEGRGGSSTMPHKRNPVAAATALAASIMAPNLATTIFAAQVQEHERSAGPWHAEWPTLPTLMLVTSGGLAAIVDLAEGLEVDAVRMRTNLDATGGLIIAETIAFALADKTGKSEAHHIVEAMSRKVLAEKRHLRDALAEDPKVTSLLSPEKIAALLEPMTYQGTSEALIDRLLASWTSNRCVPAANHAVKEASAILVEFGLSPPTDEKNDDDS